ncbi:MAG: class I SAM-dependent methyltransferase [Spirochaetia bacterium]|nr:class I SAM-dependent methyltransferase [Spirochaetia bacterium]
MSPKGAISRRCRLCVEKAALFYAPEPARLAYYWRCPSCGFIFLDPRFLPSRKAAVERYLLHDNTEESEGYVEYLQHFIETCIVPFAPVDRPVLDFGSGPHNPPVLTKLLAQRGYSCDCYDPLFAPTRAWRAKRYGCILLHEVAEHLPKPRHTFAQLPGLLDPGGILAIRTRFPPSESLDFGAWWYRMDSTHIAFYPPEAVEKFLKRLGFRLTISRRPDLLVFTAS